MASAIIHICVAKKINEHFGMNEKHLLLGSIAPDISKQIGETKHKSHFLSLPKESVPNVQEFLDKYKDSLDNPFNFGYFIHLYTDKLWFDDFISSIGYNNSVKLLDGSVITISSEEICRLIYNDYTNLNVDLIDEYELDLSLFYEEFPLPESNITEIPIDKLPILIDKMGAIIKNAEGDKNYILDISTINEFINTCTGTIIRKIEEYGLDIKKID